LNEQEEKHFNAGVNHNRSYAHHTGIDINLTMDMSCRRPTFNLSQQHGSKTDVRPTFSLSQQHGSKTDDKREVNRST
jgi:hypothetical protein